MPEFDCGCNLFLLPSEPLLSGKRCHPSAQFGRKSGQPTGGPTPSRPKSRLRRSTWHSVSSSPEPCRYAAWSAGGWSNAAYLAHLAVVVPSALSRQGKGGNQPGGTSARGFAASEPPPGNIVR